MKEEKFEIEQNYEKLRDRFKDLPEFSKINNEFELASIDKPGFLLRQIRRKLNDKNIFFCRIIENIIYPSLQTAISSYEANFFNEEEKNNMVLLHKKLMVLERESLLLDAESSPDEKDVLYIKNTFSQHDEIKSEMLNIINKMKNSWNEELKDDGEKYFG